MSMQNLLRVAKEIQDVNNDFHSLRTVLRETANKFKWNFVMFPNDGAMSHLPLIGELVIRNTYPLDPPVLHLFTATNRWNVDVYRRFLDDDTHSTMCFDVLRSKANGGTWNPKYTISCLFASLMQALVTPRVPQEYGPDILEFVSMEKLENIKRQVSHTYHDHKDRIPHLPVIPTIPATTIPAAPLVFLHTRGRSPTTTLEFCGNDTYVSQPISLQNGNQGQAWSTILDLNNLHPGIVFSVILSNKPGTDNLGNRNDTILLRNGVTGTAAKKTANNKILWFYHGKPLNDGHLSVCITVTQDQFTMSYQADGSGNTFTIHGDTPISKLGKAQIGDVEGIPFFLSIFLKRKSGKNGFINVLDQKGIGYIHAAPNESDEGKSVPPVFVKLALDSEQTTRLQNLLDFYDVGKVFHVNRSIKAPAHQTLVHQNDMPMDQYTDVIRDIYAPLQSQLIDLSVTAIVADDDCVAFLTNVPTCANDSKLPFYPKDKELHVTMRLRTRSIKPVYSNVLAKRILCNRRKGEMAQGDVYIELPQPVKLRCPLKFHY